MKFFRMPGISTLSSKDSKRFVIEHDKDRFKWMLASPTQDSVNVMRAGIIPLSSPDADISRDLAQLFKKFGIKSDHVIVSIPQNQLAARVIEIPSTKPEEIKKIVDLQAVKQTPYRQDEIVYDYSELPTKKPGYTNVMLVIVHHQILARHLNIVRDAGLTAKRVAFGIEGSAAWVHRTLLVENKASSQDDVVAVLDVDGDHTHFYVYQNDRVLFSHSISIGAEKLKTSPQEWLDKMKSNISRTIHIYSALESAQDITRLVITGVSEHLRSIHRDLQAVTGQEPLELPIPEKLQNTFDKSPETQRLTRLMSLSSVAGLANVKSVPRISLLSRESVLEMSLMKQGGDLMLLGIMVFSLIMVGIAVFAGRHYDNRHYLDWLKAKSEAMEAEANTVYETRHFIDRILEMNESSANVIEELAHVHKVVPKEIQLTELTLNKNGKFIIRGRSLMMTKVFDFVKDLEGNSLFVEVETKHLTKRLVGHKEVVDFEIDSEVRQ